MRDLLVVFLKPPRPGAVKTRLAAALGPENAAAFYRLLAEEEIRRTAPTGGEYARLLCFHPEDARAEVARWLPGEELLPQQGDDLGQRMEAACAAAFARGAERVAIVGTDVPRVSRAHVSEAFEALGSHDLVLGPAHDGGYYLVGLSGPQPHLFRGVCWGTASVFGTTVERAGVLGLSVRLLDTLRDIDTLEDVAAEWQSLRPLLRGHDDLARAVESALEARSAHARP